MRIEVIPQIELGRVNRLRVGDFLNKSISDSFCQRFRFAVAYMRMSGLDRLGASIDVLLNRGGRVSGAIGIDEEITSIEALRALSQVSSDSTIFYTISGFIYHPKLYLMSGEKQAIAVIGSPNLTSDGLFRNIELATAIYLDFEFSTDLKAYEQYETFISELLSTIHPNVQSIDENTLQILIQDGVIKSEARTKEPGPPIRSKKRDTVTEVVKALFPTIRVPVAPPVLKMPRLGTATRPSIVTPPRTVGNIGTFIMQLSAFDSSHRSGVRGTPEVLIPHAALSFFPPLLSSGRKHPDTLFDVVLNTATGRERHGYRFWYYADRSEYRLRMDRDTIDLSTPSGGDLLVINKLPLEVDNDLLYEVTILPQTDPTFHTFLNLCKYEAKGKKWGMLNT